MTSNRGWFAPIDITISPMTEGEPLRYSIEYRNVGRSPVIQANIVPDQGIVDGIQGRQFTDFIFADIRDLAIGENPCCKGANPSGTGLGGLSRRTEKHFPCY